MSSKIILTVITVAMVLATAVPIHATPINVALGASVTASGANASGTVPANLVDGDHGTFHQFYGTNNSGYWLIDLGASYTVDHAYHRAFTGTVEYDYTIRDYAIMGKLNAADPYIQLASVTGNTSTADDVYFPAATVRYVKFHVIHSNWKDPTVAEFELYEIPKPTTLTVLALGGLAVLRRRRVRA